MNIYIHRLTSTRPHTYPSMMIWQLITTTGHQYCTGQQHRAKVETCGTYNGGRSCGKGTAGSLTLLECWLQLHMQLFMTWLLAILKVHVIHQLTHVHKYQVDITHLHNWDDVLGYWQSKVKQQPVASGIVWRRSFLIIKKPILQVIPRLNTVDYRACYAKVINSLNRCHNNFMLFVLHSMPSPLKMPLKSAMHNTQHNYLCTVLYAL